MMSRAQDERYLHYIISRYAAFRNIGRSMANEYGLLKHKTTEKTEEVLFFYNGLRPNEAHSSISLYGN